MIIYNFLSLLVPNATAQTTVPTVCIALYNVRADSIVTIQINIGGIGGPWSLELTM